MLRHPGLLLVAVALSPTLLGCAIDPGSGSESRSEPSAQTSQAIGGNVWNGCQPNAYDVLQIESLTADAYGNVNVSLCVPSRGDFFNILQTETGSGYPSRTFQNKSGTLNMTNQGVGAYLEFKAEPCYSTWSGSSCTGVWTPSAFVYASVPGTFWSDVDQHGGPGPGDFQSGTESLPGGGTRALYSCAVLFNGTTQVGKGFQDAPGLCFFGYGGGEQIIPHGMVLEAPIDTAHRLYWQRWVTSARYMGPHPISAGIEPNNTEYICQAPFVNPNTGLTDRVPGKTVGGTCNISWGGREYAVDGALNDVEILNVS